MKFAMILAFVLAPGLAMAPAFAAAAEKPADKAPSTELGNIKLPYELPNRHMGVSTCSSTVCHGSVKSNGNYNVQLNEYITWSHQDSHAKAYTVLLNERSRNIAAKLGIPEASKAKICLDCHADNVPENMRGREFNLSDGVGCEACHGGAKNLQVVNRDVHDLAFLELKPDGNVLFDSSVQPPKVVETPQPNNEFLNVGFANISYLGQIYGNLFGPRFNATVSLPQYRYRFYKDKKRKIKDVDLPPIPQTVSGNPFDLQAKLDENGAPIVGPNLLPQAFSTDPGRAVITGSPHDFEAFDVPALRGIANTAPYFHDNSTETLRDAVDLYSRFILPFFTMLNLPANNPPEPGSFFPEALTPEQKADLLEFLQVL